MRKTLLTLILLSSFAAFAQTPAIALSVDEPTTLDASNRATWSVRVVNTSTVPVNDMFVVFNHLAHFPFHGQWVSIPENCVSDYAVGCNVDVAPEQTVVLNFVLQYNERYGAASVTVSALSGALRVRDRTAFMHEYLVTTTADSGEGSLRNAILDMNRDCTNAEPCGPVFRIDGPVPQEGWFTIRPLSPLPQVTVPFGVFDGRSQARHSGETNLAGPEIMLDGSEAGRANGLHFGGGTAHVRYLAIGNFNGNGIEHDGGTLDVYRAFVGLHPSGMRAASNAWRGIQANQGEITIANSFISGNGRAGVYINAALSSVLENHIGVGVDGQTPVGNGASGLFFQKSGGSRYDWHSAAGNVVANNGQAGIGFNPNVIGNFGNNTFLNNGGLALDAGMDGRTLAGREGVPGHGGIIPAPSIVSAQYANGITTIEGTFPPTSQTVLGPGTVYVYANGDGKDGGEVIGTARLDASQGAGSRFVLQVARDLRGQYVSAATFLYLIYGWDDPAPGVSEASLPLLVR